MCLEEGWDKKKEETTKPNNEKDKVKKNEKQNTIEKKEFTKEKSINKEKKEQKPNLIRKYFKYEDGKIKYIKDFSKTKFEKEGLSLKDVKDNLNKEIEMEKRKFDIKSFINKLLIVFIIFSMVFVYFYYIKDNNSHEKDSNNEPTTEYEESKNQTKNEKQLENESNTNDYVFYKENESISDESVTDLSKGEIAEKITANVRNYNTEELKKVQNYIDLKGNRVSTVSTIKKNKKEKENLYIYLTKNQKLFKKDKEFYDEIENLLIKSIAMSEEFIVAFNDDSINIRLQEIIDCYQN